MLHKQKLYVKTLFLINFALPLFAMEKRPAKKQTTNTTHHYNLRICNNKKNHVNPIFIPKDIALYVTKFLDQESNGRFRSVCKSTEKIVDPKRTLLLSSNLYNPTKKDTFRDLFKSCERRALSLSTNKWLSNNPVELDIITCTFKYLINTLIETLNKTTLSKRTVTFNSLNWFHAPAIIPRGLTPINFPVLEQLYIQRVPANTNLTALIPLAPQLKKLHFFYTEWKDMHTFLREKSSSNKTSIFQKLEMLTLTDLFGEIEPHTFVQTIKELPSLKKLIIKSSYITCENTNILHEELKYLKLTL